MPVPMSLQSFWSGQQTQVNDAFTEESSPFYSVVKPLPTIQGNFLHHSCMADKH